MHTHQTVHDIIQENWESDMPDRVLEALRPWEGKMITTRIVDKLPGGKDVWHLERAYGMTHIKSRAYVRSQGAEDISLLLGHTESSFPFSLKDLEDKNPAYFSERKKRNHRRMETMNTKQLLDRMAAVMNRVEAALKELETANKDFEALAGYGKPFSPDRFSLERACGAFYAKRHAA